jgi:bifunctional enzyme CysN/CysC
VSQKEYEGHYGQKGATIWITGLHGSGKNQLAYTLEKKLFDRGAVVVLLDGKTVRAGLSKELDFSPADRAEHLRRVAHLCKMLNDKGIITICSFISPDEDIRNQLAAIINSPTDNSNDNQQLTSSAQYISFHLIYMDADIELCKKNDSYGLYEQATKGEIHNVPGIDCDYEKPLNAQMILIGTKGEQAVGKVIEYLEGQLIIQ